MPDNTPTKMYAVVNLADSLNPTVTSFWDGNLMYDPEHAKQRARNCNEAMKPEFQTYTVVTVTFDAEV